MKIVVERSIRDKLQDFFNYLKNRAKDKDHENNRDLIADFVDRVLVFEIKRLANDNTTTEEQIEIPDNVLIGPLRKAHSKFNSAFDEYLKKLGADPGNDSNEPESDIPESNSSESGKTRSGNGHKKNKVRDLNDSEKDIIHAEFLYANGQFLYKDCSKKLKPQMGSDIAIWQITGFVSYLHTEVARSNIGLPNLSQYLSFLKNKYPSLSKQYDSPKYQQLRIQKANATQSVTQTPIKPLFRTRLKRKV